MAGTTVLLTMKNQVIVRSSSSALALLLLSPAWAFAAEGHSDSPSIFAGDLGNVFWTLVTFLAVVLVLRRYAWGPILSALQKREEFIRDSLASAKKDREEAEARLSELEARLHKARDEATAIVDEGRKDAEVLKRKIEQDTKREADAMIERAKREISLARDTAVKQMYDLTATLATEAASKIIAEEIDATRHERLIAESIEELAKN